MTNTNIASMIREKQDPEGMLRRALERIIQLYTDKSHFVYELLQNAEDAGATKIKFIEYADRLVVLHNGRPFSVENLQGLCDIGKSDKTKDLNQIGEFGVGFKSVFGICKTVRLYSHPTKVYQDLGYKQFAVEIQDFTRPVDIDYQEIEADYTTEFVFPYSVGFTFSGFKTREELTWKLSQRLQDLGITTLLFMKNLKSIDYIIDIPSLKTEGTYQLEKKPVNEHCTLVSAIGIESNKNESEKTSYLVFTRPVDFTTIGRTIDIAFAVTVETNGDYIFKPAHFPYISVYFPTETESKLDFIVQGPYRTTPNRSSVPADDKDNIYLAEQTAKLLRDSVIELRDAKKLNFSLLNILPFNENAFESAPLLKCMFEETEDMLRNEQVLLNNDGSYSTADSVKIARNAELAALFTTELLTELFGKRKTYHWLPTFLTESNKSYKALYEFLTGVINIGVIRPEDLRSSFNTNKTFLYHRDDEWLVKLYNMYSAVANAFSKQRAGSNMLTAIFIKTSEGYFVAPYRKSDGSNLYDYYKHGSDNVTYLPNVFLPSQNNNDISDIKFVDENIFRQCMHFFTDVLQLQKPNDYEFFIRDLRKRYDSGQSITEEQRVSDLKKLLYYRTNQTYANEVNALISEYMEVRCKQDGQKVYLNPSTTRILFSVTSDGMSIEQYFLHIASFPYIDLDYYKLEGIERDELATLGVSDDISRGMDEVCGEYYVYTYGRNPNWTTYGTFRWQLNIEKLDEVLEYISDHPKELDSMAKSNFIFRFLQKHEDKLCGTVFIGGNQPDIPDTYSSIVRKLRMDGNKSLSYGMKWNGKWLFTKAGELVSQKEISKRDLNPQLYGMLQENTRLYEILGFDKSKEDILEGFARKYDCLDEETKKKYFEIELQRRYGISVSELEKNLDGSEPSTFNGVPNGTTGTTIPSFEFPSARVRNWDYLRKHVAEVLAFAKPVEYEYKVRKLRVSQLDNEISAYLKGMYKVDGGNQYACQMCHNPSIYFEKCQLTPKMDKELEAMYLCMCPACAANYRQKRGEDSIITNFLVAIYNLSDNEINQMDPVKIAFADKTIWFTQTHIAEIRELIALKTAIAKNIEPPKVNGTGTEAYKGYIGKMVSHESLGRGIVTKCDGINITIEFYDGKKAGNTIDLQLEFCRSLLRVMGDVKQTDLNIYKIIPVSKIDGINLIKKKFKYTKDNSSFLAVMLTIKFYVDSPLEDIESCKGYRKIYRDIVKNITTLDKRIKVHFIEKFNIPQKDINGNILMVNNKPLPPVSEVWSFELPKGFNQNQVEKTVELFTDTINSGIQENKYWVIEIV